jgi:hypothetical protein
MSCERYAPAIDDHACGADLAPDAAAHVASCVGCAGRLAQQRRAVAGLDVELQQMLAVEPSPFFAQRVHAHVMTSRARQSFRAVRWGALAAAAAIVVAALLLRVDRQPPAAIQVQTETPPATPPPTATDPREKLVAPPPSPKESPVTSPQRVQSERRLAKAPEPEVLVPPDQKRAIARYMTLLRSGELGSTNLSDALQSTDAPSSLLDVVPLAVSPLAVKTIDTEVAPGAERPGDGTSSKE